MNLLGNSSIWTGFLGVLSDIAEKISTIVDLLDMVINFRLPSWMSWESFSKRSYEKFAPKDKLGRPIVPYDEYQRGADVKAETKKYNERQREQDAKREERTRKIEEDARAKRDKELDEKYPGTRKQRDDTGVKLKKVSDATDKVGASLVNYAEAKHGPEVANIIKASLGGAQQYGGSMDAKYLGAGYTPSGRGYFGGSAPGGDQRAGGGTGYGGGTRLAPPYSGGPTGPGQQPGGGMRPSGPPAPPGAPRQGVPTGPGAPRPGAPQAPPTGPGAPGGATRRDFSPDVNAAINKAAAATGMDPAMLNKFAEIESGGKPGVQTGSYKGLFQLSESEFQKYMPGGNIMDPGQNAMAAAQKLKAELAQFKAKFGRDPEGHELYMMHQQGWGGLQAHMEGAKTGRSAWESMYSTKEGQQKGAEWAKKAIWGNMSPEMKKKYGSVENVPSSEFLDMWKQRYARARGGEATGPQVASWGAPPEGVGPPGGGPTPGQRPEDIPGHYQGEIEMEGQKYRYGTGGSGRGSTPPGSYNVNIGAEAQFGPKAAGLGSIATIGGRGGTYKDPRYATEREGVQIHAATSARLDKLYSAGCIAVHPDDWPRYKAHLLDLNRRTPGGLRIDIGKDGRAQIVARGSQVPVPGGPDKGDQVAGGKPSNIPGGPDAIGATADDWAEDIKAGTPEHTFGGDEDIKAAPPIVKAPPKEALPPQVFKGTPEEYDKYQSSRGGTGGLLPPTGAPTPSRMPLLGGDEQRDVNIRMNVNDTEMQFARSSLRRQADREVREARWSSYSDIGAA